MVLSDPEGGRIQLDPGCGTGNHDNEEGDGGCHPAHRLGADRSHRIVRFLLGFREWDPIGEFWVGRQLQETCSGNRSLEELESPLDRSILGYHPPELTRVTPSLEGNFTLHLKPNEP